MTDQNADRLRLINAGGGQPVGDEGVLRRYELDWTILMARAQEGDADAYLRLLQQITPYLRTRAARFHRASHDVEDTVQDILLTLHTVRHTYDPSRPFGPWLVGIANRRAFDRLRRQGRERAHEVPLGTEHEAFGAEPDQGSAAVDQAVLDKAINQLAPAQQQAIRMLKLRGMSLNEAASSTGMSIASLKMATHRALKKLRELLADRSEQ